MKAKFIKEIWMVKKKGIQYINERKNCAYMYQIREMVAEAVTYKDQIIKAKKEVDVINND